MVTYGLLQFKREQLGQNQSPTGIVLILIQSTWNHLIQQSLWSQPIIFPNDARRQMHHKIFDVETVCWRVVVVTARRTHRRLGRSDAFAIVFRRSFNFDGFNGAFGRRAFNTFRVRANARVTETIEKNELSFIYIALKTAKVSIYRCQLLLHTSGGFICLWLISVWWTNVLCLLQPLRCCSRLWHFWSNMKT